MRKSLLFTTVICLFTALSAFTPSAPSNVTDTHLEICGPFSDYSPCNGEVITTTGCEEVDVHTVVNGNRVNVSAHVKGHLTSTDESGNTYETNVNFNRTLNGSLNNGQMVFDEVLNAEFISKGSAPNYIIRFKYHFTVNANGEATAELMSGSGECRG